MQQEKVKKGGSGFQPRNQMLRLEAASTNIYPVLPFIFNITKIDY